MPAVTRRARIASYSRRAICTSGLIASAHCTTRSGDSGDPHALSAANEVRESISSAAIATHINLGIVLHPEKASVERPAVRTVLRLREDGRCYLDVSGPGDFRAVLSGCQSSADGAQ